jgi:hypothetical protein
MHVGSHRLPDLVAHLIERGEWKTPPVERILAIPHQDAGLHFQDPALMECETAQLAWICDEGSGRWYALEPGSTRDEMLDPHRAVSIATSHTERGLCLDYRYAPPRVVAHGDRGWVVVAASFDEFWRAYLA